MKFSEYDVVKLKIDDVSSDLKAGTKGTIVLTYKSVEPHYEVEFCDDAGNTLAIVAMSEEKLEKFIPQ